MLLLPCFPLGRVAESWVLIKAELNVTRDMHAVRELAGRNEYRADSRADNWIGRAIGERLDLDVTDPASAGKVKRISKTWIKNGVLAIDEREDDHRKKRKYVIPGQLKDPTHGTGAELAQK
jgi:hypothetical protein